MPVKGDEVDQALGDFLNEAGIPLDIMFVRLQPGIYSFGSKKVCVKVENHKINIRIGGGYMAIDEFLEKYTVMEQERATRREDAAMEKVRQASPVKGSKSNYQ